VGLKLVCQIYGGVGSYSFSRTRVGLKQMSTFSTRCPRASFSRTRVGLKPHLLGRDARGQGRFSRTRVGLKPDLPDRLRLVALVSAEPEWG